MTLKLVLWGVSYGSNGKKVAGVMWQRFEVEMGWAQSDSWNYIKRSPVQIMILQWEKDLNEHFSNKMQKCPISM